MNFIEPLLTKHIKLSEANLSEISTTTNSFNQLLKKQKKLITKYQNCSISEFNTSLKLDQKTQDIEKYNQAIQQLQEDKVPNSLPCRIEEKNLIKNFILNGIESHGCNEALYISGVPGIGKTVLLKEVMKDVQQQKQQLMQVIWLNGMELKRPEKLYQILLKEITGIKKKSEKAAYAINEMFRNGRKGKTLIVIIDELDYLLTADQKLLYNIFDWPHQANANLIVIGIANTMDFPERLLPKIASRIGNRRVVFKPYTSYQINEIVKQRLEQFSDLIQRDSIQFLSRKIAAFSSDIRRTLHVCRNAFEIARDLYLEQYVKQSNLTNLELNENTNEFPLIIDNDQEIYSDKVEIIKVTIAHIRQAHNNIYFSPYHQALTSLSKYQKILLISLGLELKLRNINFGYFNDVYQRAKNMAKSALGLKNFIEMNFALEIFKEFSSIGIISLKEKNWLKTKHDQEQNSQLNPNNNKVYNIQDYQIIFNARLDDLTNVLLDDDIYLKFSNLF